MFKAKPYLKVSKDKDIYIPRPPRYATHAILETDCGRKACVAIKDFDTLWGTSGYFTFARFDSKMKLKEEYKEQWYWTGTYVDGIEELLDL